MGEQHQWSELETAFLQMSVGKLSASQIAAELGLSRNAVIGKARRLGLSVKPVTSVVKPEVVKPALPPPAVGTKYERLADMPLIHLKAHQCKWPLSGWPEDTLVTFCGKPRLQDHPYCAAHCRESYPWFTQ